jgi:ribosomal protein S18 acetylase RimI-like enzyme
MSQDLSQPTSDALLVRPATAADIPSVARILAEAFPLLYRATFGRVPVHDIARLLESLYRADILTLEATRVCIRDNRVAGLIILHTGHPIGRGSAMNYWHTLSQTWGIVRTPRAFVGGLSQNTYLTRRIPHAPDLVYIEALAVAPGSRGRGIGTRLLAEAEEFARSQGRTRLALHVLHSNTGARRLYLRSGFRPWKDAPGRQASWAALLMVRYLRPRSESDSPDA